MSMFSTREIAIFIYAVILIIYILAKNKGKKILMPVMKAACHIKLIIPFIVVLMFATAFVWICTYLKFWDWVYLKDIVFWTLFAGVPICFNAASRKIDEHYFRNIIIDNLKFAALVEFITGTFTFHIVIELILQPLLVFFIMLQYVAKEKSTSVKKFVDGIVGVTGILIIVFTINSAINAIDTIHFVDIIVGLLLPIAMSVLYLPLAYFFAVYSKYEILFLRMSFKEPEDKKIRRKHRIEVLKTCKLSYAKICRFLNEYVQKMYVTMPEADFCEIIDDFRKTK